MLLADALSLAGEVRALFMAAARGRAPAAEVLHAAHRLSGSFPDGQFFLPLHAHTPGQRPVGPADALASLLLTAGVAEQHIPPGMEARAGRRRDYVAGKKILLLLEHEQVRPLLPGTAGSLVLVTSRRRLIALEDAAVISLATLSPDEVAVLLARLAGRADLRAGPGPAGQITRLCGYLPLAIGMLARQLRHHPARTGAELAADLAAASGRLAVMRAENLSVAAAFDLSYVDLTAVQQQLFRRLGLIPGPDIAESTAWMARLRHLGNCSSTSSRTVSGETVSWLACMSTPAASRVPIFSRNKLSPSPGSDRDAPNDLFGT